MARVSKRAARKAATTPNAHKKMPEQQFMRIVGMRAGSGRVLVEVDENRNRDKGMLGADLKTVVMSVGEVSQRMKSLLELYKSGKLPVASGDSLMNLVQMSVRACAEALQQQKEMFEANKDRYEEAMKMKPEFVKGNLDAFMAEHGEKAQDQAAPPLAASTQP